MGGIVNGAAGDSLRKVVSESPREEVLRILDVNLNRARESLRVIEDHARFVLIDTERAAAAKQLRHDLQDIVRSIGPAALLSARDIAGDASRSKRTVAEQSRAVAGDVLGAAFGRLTEAARAIAEYSKIAWPRVTERAEQLRYAAYELEQRFQHDPLGMLRRTRLYVLITASLCKRPWLETACAALEGGARCLQLREKSLPDGELLSRAAQLRELTRKAAALFIVNDRPDIARLVQADGVHLGQDDLTVAQARRIVGHRALIGKSTHTPAQIAAALDENPDYIAVGPVFQSATKPQNHIAGLETLAAARQRTRKPLVAIGGIDAANAASCINAGAGCVCVCSAVISASDPQAAAKQILAALPAQVEREAGGPEPEQT